MKLQFGIAVTVAATVTGTFMFAAQEVKSQWDGVYTLEQAKRGELLYDKQCAVCHASDLMGGLEATPLVGSAFTPTWDGVNLGELFERIRTTMPQDDVGGLSKQQTANILAFILSKDGYPAGAAELPAEAEMLQYKFLAKKPAAK